MSGDYELDFAEEGDDRFVAEPFAGAARLSAAKMLLAQSRRIQELLFESEGQVTPELEARIQFAGGVAAAIRRPPVEMPDRCADDGTRVRWDPAHQEYCCLMDHCPPVS